MFYYITVLETSNVLIIQNTLLQVSWCAPSKMIYIYGRDKWFNISIEIHVTIYFNKEISKER